MGTGLYARLLVSEKGQLGEMFSNTKEGLISIDSFADKLNVYLDCRARCDLDFIKGKISYINYVRDQQLADVHLLITRYPMASNGTQYTLAFIGQEELLNINNTFTYDNLPNIPQDKARKNLVKHIELGLVPYLLHTKTASNINVKVLKTAANQEKPSEKDDNWNFWVFDIYMRGSLDKESSRRTFKLDGGLEIERVTENWRITQTPYFRGNYQKIINDDVAINSTVRRMGTAGRFVKSINQHWSVGTFNSIAASTTGNTALSLRLGPALEYSIFPYQEVVTREFTIAYHVGYHYRDYLEETIYGKFSEELLDHSLSISLRIRAPWGSISSSLEGKHFFHDFSKNNMEWRNRVSYRLVKGLSVDFTANLELINDQLFIPRGTATLEDILLQQRQLATNFDLYLSFGFSYTFGSIYNNIINTRL